MRMYHFFKESRSIAFLFSISEIRVLLEENAVTVFLPQLSEDFFDKNKTLRGLPFLIKSTSVPLALSIYHQKIICFILKLRPS